MDLSPLARIIVRYAAGFFVAKGLLPSETGATLAIDIDVINYVDLALGISFAAISEGWYALARRFGWAK